VNSWLKTSEKTVVNKIVIAVIPVKNPEIPVLKNYVSGATENFWKAFPSKEMPTAAVTKISLVIGLEQSPEKHTVPEIRRPIIPDILSP
jgi:hypothetical protein